MESKDPYSINTSLMAGISLSLLPAVEVQCLREG
jgi:hypothetical protein